MNDPAVQYKFDLQNNDILFVPIFKTLVTIEGAVNRPMSYEMLAKETLIDLVRFAGGLKMNAYPDFVQIQRYVNGEEKLLEWNLAEVTSGKTKVALINGDVVRIKSIGKPMDQYVDIEGSVYYPGRFDLLANPRLSSLLKNAKPGYQAKTDVLFVERVRPDETVELLTIPFPDIETGANDFFLQARDKVRIMSQAAYRDMATIAVSGQVRLPFVKNISLTDKLTVKEALAMAGGVKNSVYPVAYIFRRNLLNPVEVSYIRIELAQSGNMELQAGDQLNIYDNTTYTNVGELRVSGAVKNPNAYTYDATLGVHDLLINAGGFNVGAAFDRVQVFRTVLSPTEATKLELITLSVDSSYQVVDPVNFKLQPYDQVVVRLTPEFTLGRTVEISGQVKYPGMYVLESHTTQFSEVVQLAGGLLDAADPNGTQLFRTYNNRGNISMNVVNAMSHPASFSKNPILFEGDVINIKPLENTVSIMENGTRMAQYSVNPTNNGIKNVVFQGQKSAAWYIRKYAGGFVKEADRNSVTVTLPNNQMISTNRFLFGLRDFPTVKSGSMITMKLKPPKTDIEKEREKINWDAVWSKTLAAATTALTIWALVSKL